MNIHIIYFRTFNFDGPAGSPPITPNGSRRWPARDGGPDLLGLPENVGQYRDDRRNVYLDGKSNLVFRAAKDGNTYYSGKLFGKYRGGIGTPGRPDQAELPHSGLLARVVPGQQQPRQRRRSRHHGVVRQRPLGGGTAVHAKLNGGEHVSQTITVDSGWHTWRVQWDDAGMRFWKDYVDGAQPYFNVPASSLPDWQFNAPGYPLFRSWISRSRGPAAVTPGRGPIRRTCSSTGCVSGRTSSNRPAQSGRRESNPRS